MKTISGVALVVLALAAPAFAQVPNMKATIEQLARDNPNTFACAHTSAPCGHNFVKLVACKLNPQPSEGRFGLNGKRGNPKDLSYDALNYRGVGPGVDKANPANNPVTVIDFIVGAGAPGARVDWNPFSDPEASSGAWVQPRCKGDVWDPNAVDPTPQPPAPSKPPYPGDQWGQKLAEVLWADYQEAGQPANTGMGVWFWRTAWDAVELTMDVSIKKHRNEWRSLLGLQPAP